MTILNTLELKIEATVHSSSGQLLVIDPAYLDDFDDSYEKLDDEMEGKLSELMQQEIELIHEDSKITQQLFDEVDSLLKEIDEKSKDPSSISEDGKNQLAEQRGLSDSRNSRSEEIQKQRAEIKEKKKQLWQEYGVIPPKIAQHPDYVLFSNGIGDGDYPVVQTKEGIEIVFNYHLKQEGSFVVVRSLLQMERYLEKAVVRDLLSGLFVRKFEYPYGRTVLDESRLPGKLLGSSAVDTARQIIVDPIHVKISEDIKPELYVFLSVSPGAYSCRFIQNNDALEIRRV